MLIIKSSNATVVCTNLFQGSSNTCYWGGGSAKLVYTLRVLLTYFLIQINWEKCASHRHKAAVRAEVLLNRKSDIHFCQHSFLFQLEIPLRDTTCGRGIHCSIFTGLHSSISYSSTSFIIV